ncbi:MAG: protein translocase subunit SecD [Gemmatimonadetes bacterium]|nr:protein translocase subunit SecD [Gemmatimonadota bacterium]
MFSTIQSRLIFIGLIVAAAAFSLWPRNVTRRAPGADGVMRDTVERRVSLKRGLDLQGGIHLALEIDQSKGTVVDPAGALDRALTVVRTRVDEFGVAEPLVQKVGNNRIVVELAGMGNAARAKDIVQRSAFLEFRIVDMQNQFRDAIAAIDAELRRMGIRSGPGAAPVGAGAVEKLLGRDSGKVKGAAKDTAETGTALSSLLFNGSEPGEYLVPDEEYPRADSLIHLPEVRRLIPRGLDLLWAAQSTSQGARSYKALYAVQARPIITGEYLADARAQVDPVYNQPVVNFQLNRQGGRIFGRETARHIGDYMAIVLDGRVQGRPPVIRSQINQRGQIEMGSGPLQQAQDLALVLRAGSLPAPLIIVEERTVGPSLGADSIHDGITAGVYGTIAVIIIMAAYYRIAGLLAIAALGFYVLLTLGGLGAFGATLTLPGLAGFVLSIGIAVDANVLIFERIREELAAGKTIPLAVDQGFRRAMNAIVDSNVCAILTSMFLYQFGTGPVKGFAVTLILGVLASMITAIFITRTFFMVWLKRRPTMETLSI